MPAAVLIGIDDYSTFDASLGHPAGTTDLRGARRDARAWIPIAKALGFDEIRVLTSPVLDPADLADPSGVTLLEATEEQILDATRWLAQQLQSAKQGLFTWSGHGALRADGAVLLPCDTTGEALDGSALQLTRHEQQSSFDARHITAPLESTPQ